MPRNPRRIAANDAPGKLLMNASTPCMKSRLSYSSAAVASDGAPSSNSNVPRRVSTRSGVEIDFRVSAETPVFTLVALIVLLLRGFLLELHDRDSIRERRRSCRSRTRRGRCRRSGRSRRGRRGPVGVDVELACRFEVEHVRHRRGIDSGQRSDANQHQGLRLEARGLDRVRRHAREQVQERGLACRSSHGAVFRRRSWSMSCAEYWRARAGPRHPDGMKIAQSREGRSVATSTNGPGARREAWRRGARPDDAPPVEVTGRNHPDRTRTIIGRSFTLARWAERSITALHAPELEAHAHRPRRSA